MKKIFYIIGLSIIFQSCVTESKSESKEIPATEKTIEIETNVKEIDPNIQGRKELSLFESNYESKWGEKPKTFPYSDGKLYKVFKLDCSGECFKSEFKKRESSGIEIPKDDFIDLVELLRDSKSYENSTAACYDPKVGLIVYDSKNIPTEFLSICLNCNNFRTYPGQIDINYENKLLYGFSKETRKKLRDMFLKWGIDYYGFSSFWDDEKEYQKYLEKKNDTTTKAKQH